MRKKKEHTSVDSAECYKCQGCLETEGDAPGYSIDQMSGATWDVVCPHCGTNNTVSPSIEWLTWEGEG